VRYPSPDHKARYNPHIWGHAMNPIFTDHLPMNLHAREHHIVRPELDIYFSTVINFDIKDSINPVNG